MTGVIERQGDGEGVTVHVELGSAGCYSRVLACPWDGSDNFTFSIVNESLCVSRSVPNSVDCPQLSKSSTVICRTHYSLGIFVWGRSWCLVAACSHGKGGCAGGGHMLQS